jgi:hypothetical protein
MSPYRTQPRFTTGTATWTVSSPVPGNSGEHLEETTEDPIEDTPPSIQELVQDLRQQMDGLIGWLAHGVTTIEDGQNLMTGFNELTDSLARVPDVLARETLLCRLEAMVMAEQQKDRTGLNVAVMSNFFSGMHDCRRAVTDRALQATQSEINRIASGESVDIADWEQLVDNIVNGCALGERVSHLQLVSGGIAWMAGHRGIVIPGLETLFNQAQAAASISQVTYLTCRELLGMKKFDPERHAAKVIGDCAGLFNKANACPEPYKTLLKNQAYAALVRVAESSSLLALQDFLQGVAEPKPADAHVAPESKASRELEEEFDPNSFDTAWFERPRSPNEVRYKLRPDLLMARFDERLRACVDSLRLAAASLGAGDVVRRFQAVNDTILAAQPDQRPALYEALNFELLVFAQEHPGAWKQVLPSVRIPNGEPPDTADRNLHKAVDVLLEQFANRRASDYRQGRTQDEDCEKLITAIHKFGGASSAHLLSRLARGLNLLRLNHNDPEMGASMKRVLDRWFDPLYKNWIFRALLPQ